MTSAERIHHSYFRTMAGSLSPTPPPISESEEDDGASRGSKEVSPTQGTGRSTRSPSVAHNLPPTRAELQGYSSLLGSLALRDANAFGPRLLGTPIWSPTPRLSEAGSPPEHLRVPRRGAGLIPTPLVPARNEKRQVRRKERKKFRATLPKDWLAGQAAQQAQQAAEKEKQKPPPVTLWPTYPQPYPDEEPLDDVVEETAFGIVVKDRLKLPYDPRPARSGVIKPRDEDGRFISTSDAEDEELGEEDEDIEFNQIDDDDEIPPDVAKHIASAVQAQIDQTLATIAACRPQGTEKQREHFAPMDWRAVLSAAAVTVDTT